MRWIYFFVLISGLSFPAQAAPVASLQSHKALYDVKLKSVRSGSMITDIRGQMFYEWVDECEAWTTDHRFHVDYDFGHRSSMRMISGFSSWESKDGAQYYFSSTQEKNGVLIKEVRGAIDRVNRYAPATAKFTKPHEFDLNLDGEIQFPTAHMLELFQKASRDEKFINSFVFDGSTEEGAYEINGFIGEIQDPLARIDPALAEIDTKLLTSSPARLVQMAFFPPNGTDPDPEYEMAVVFHDNGIVSHMTVTYPEFAVEHNLKALTVLPVPPCAE